MTSSCNNCAPPGLLRAFTAPEMVKGVRCSKCCPDPANPADPAQPVPAGAYTKHIRTVSFGKVCIYWLHLF